MVGVERMQAIARMWTLEDALWSPFSPLTSMGGPGVRFGLSDLYSSVLTCWAISGPSSGTLIGTVLQMLLYISQDENEYCWWTILCHVPIVYQAWKCKERDSLWSSSLHRLSPYSHKQWKKKVYSDRNSAPCVKAPATRPDSLSTIPRMYIEERIGSHKLCSDFHVHIGMHVPPCVRTYTQNK